MRVFYLNIIIMTKTFYTFFIRDVQTRQARKNYGVSTVACVTRQTRLHIIIVYGFLEGTFMISTVRHEIQGGTLFEINSNTRIYYLRE